jgi:hypothetical protein
MKKFAVIIFAFILSCALAACGGDSGTGRTGGTGGTGGASGGTDSGGSAQTQTNDTTPTPTPDDNSDAAASTPGPTPPPITAAVGDLIEFGDYEWRVLEVSGGKALIMTDKLIGFSRRYHGVLEPVTWADCDLRAYLNGAFYNSFPDADRARIAGTQNLNKDNQWYDSGVGGADTTDKIFLLSLEEVVKYFGDSGQLANQPQDEVYMIYDIDDAYNDARIAYDKDGNAGTWWLRSPGGSRNNAAMVNHVGKINVLSGFASFGYIRPVLWLSLDYPENPDYALAPVSSPPSLNPDTQVGDTVVFGIYRWRVLAVEDGKALLLSDRAIDPGGQTWVPYHSSDTAVTWANCSLRAYLNGDFYNSFGPNPYDREKVMARIVLTRNSNKSNQWYYAGALERNQGADFFMPPPEGGADTDDYIFLLSLEEVVRYLGSGRMEERQLRPGSEYEVIDDQYNEARIVRSFRSEDAWPWWLRSPGEFGDKAAYVDSDGTINVSGSGFHYWQIGVRPAMWVNLE